MVFGLAPYYDGTIKETLTEDKHMKTFYELTREEIEELKFAMLWDDANEFYESIDEISDNDVMRRFGNKMFRSSDFSCNYIEEPDFAA